MRSYTSGATTSTVGIHYLELRKQLVCITSSEALTRSPQDTFQVDRSSSAARKDLTSIG
ncbi:MAG: hypothetical protein ABSF77_02790 [Spirochaetia bacterium]